MFKRDIPLDTVKQKFADEQSKFITIDGFEVHYKTEGTGEPLLLLHSVNTTLQDWDLLAASLKDHFQVVRLDLPGFGLSEFNKNFDFKLDTYIYFLKKFTTQIGLKTFHLTGVGWGADLAWHYCILHHYLVNKLVLINPTDHPEYKLPRYQRASRSPFGSIIYRWSGSKSIIKKRAKKWFSNLEQIKDTDIERYQMMLLKSGNRKAFVRFNRAFHRDRYDRLEKLPTPTLLLCSKTLGKNPLENKIPNVTTHYYEKTNNYPMIELPNETAKDMLDFLK